MNLPLILSFCALVGEKSHCLLYVHVFPSKRYSASPSLAEKKGTDRDVKEVSLAINKAKSHYFYLLIYTTAET